MVSSNPSLGPSPTTKISYFLLSVCVDELLSTTKIKAIFPKSKFKIKKCDRELNLIPYQE